MFISPGEIARGQWLMIHSSKKEEIEKNWAEQDNPITTFGMLMAPAQSADYLIPHIVLSVQLPFIAVADCTTNPCRSLIWRTDKSNLVEINDDFVKALDIWARHRGQKLLNPNYVIPYPQTPYGNTPPVGGLADLLEQLMSQPIPPEPPKPKSPRKKKNP